LQRMTDLRTLNGHSLSLTRPSGHAPMQTLRDVCIRKRSANFGIIGFWQLAAFRSNVNLDL
jgi:hypothetical protein